VSRSRLGALSYSRERCCLRDVSQAGLCRSAEYVDGNISADSDDAIAEALPP
jgi:hypothetical protein